MSMNTNKRCVIDVETTGLLPTDSRLVCIGLKDCETGETLVFWDEDEKEMVQKFLDYYHQKGFREIIGFNLGFDVQHIFAKILKYRLEPNGFLRSNTRDIMKTLKSINCGYTTNRSGTLNDWTTYLFGESKSENGCSIPELFEKGEVLKIIQYNIRDVELTFKLWKRIQEVMA